MKRQKIVTIEELPDILTPQQVANYMGISRGRVYTYCQLTECAGGLRSFTLGKSRKIEKSDLIDWKENQKKAQQP